MAKHPTPPDDTEGFVGRWSRRKRQAHENRSPEAPTAPEAGSEATTDPLGPVVDAAPVAVDAEAPAKTDADMPPVDSIDEHSDISDFFSPGVSDTLRQAALHKLFRLPKFNVIDALDDYNEDFTTFAALGDIITADMRHRAEVEAERLKEKARQVLAEEQAAALDDAATAAEKEDADEPEPEQRQREHDDSRSPIAREERAQPPLEDEIGNT